MWQPLRAVFVSSMVAAGCAPARSASSTPKKLTPSPAASALHSPTEAPATRSATTDARSGGSTQSAGLVVPPEQLPAFDPALVRSLGAEGVRRLQVAASLCPTAVVHDAGKLRVGCRTCPPFDATTGPDGKVVVDPPPQDDFYELEGLFDGSFSAPGRSETAALFRGCESHADNFGGTLLAERRGPVWVQKSYRSGFHPATCRTFRKADAQDLLVCLWETDHQSSAHWLLDTYDFTAGDDAHAEKGWHHLLAVDDDSIASCWADQSETSHVTADEIVSYVVHPATARSQGQVVARVRFARGPITAAYRAQCAQLDQGTRAAHPGATLSAETRNLVLVWDGTRFVADATTEATMRHFGLMSPPQLEPP